MNVWEYVSAVTVKTQEVFEFNIPGYVLSDKNSWKSSEWFMHRGHPNFKFSLTLITPIFIELPSATVSYTLQLFRIPNCELECNSSNIDNLSTEIDVLFILYTNSIYKWSCSMRMKGIQVTAILPEISSYDCMTIQCIIMSNLQKTDEYEYPNNSDLPEASHSLSLDMSAILDNGKFADIVLGVEDKEFNVHRCILAARSNVFAAMFKHDTQEQRENRVVIADFSSDVIYQALKYIYTDQTSELTPDQYLSLYSAADKYAITDLRKKCCQQLKKQLPVNSVIQVLVTADLHQDDDLKEAALRTFLKNPVSVMSNEEWLPFMQNHTQLASSILMHLAKKSSGRAVKGYF